MINRQLLFRNKVVKDYGSLLTNNNSYVGVRRAQNGKIYFAPYSFPNPINSVLVLDESTKTFSTVPFNGTAIQSVAPYQYFQGVVDGGNGKLYFSPFGGRVLMIYDYINDVITYGSNLNYAPAGGASLNGGFLASDGNVYLIPYNRNTFVRINTINDSTTLFGTTTAASRLGGVYAPNGFLYQPPSSISSFLKINPINGTQSTFGNFGSGLLRWINGCNGLDGKIYFAPLLTNTILVLDTSNDSFFQIPITGLGGSAYCANLQLAPNGNIYGFPYSANGFIEISTRTSTARMFKIGSYDSSYHGNCISSLGLVGAPRNKNTVSIIENIGNVTSEMLAIPVDVSTIASSLYNLYQSTL
jgi:hypothetical protein